MLKKFFCFTLCTLALFPAAFAQESYSQDGTFASFDMTLPAPGGSVGSASGSDGEKLFTTSFQPFNSSLGDLVAFQINFYPSGSMSGVLPSSPPPPNIVVSGASASVSGGYVIGGMLSGNVLTGGITVGDNQGAGGGMGTGGIGQSFDIPLSMNSNGDVLYLTEAGTTFNAAVLPYLLGNDPFVFTWDAPVGFSMSGLTPDLRITVSGSPSLTYFYTPVPEPAAGVLLALALVGLTVRRRR